MTSEQGQAAHIQATSLRKEYRSGPELVVPFSDLDLRSPRPRWCP